MSSTDIKRLEKYVPSNIICTLSHVDYKVFPVKCNPVSRAEMLRILHYFLRTGETLPEIKKLLLEVVDGKENDISDFVNSYKQRKNTHIIENILMILIGFFIAVGLLKALNVARNE